MPIILQKVSYNGHTNSNSTHPWYSHYNVFDGSEVSFWESSSFCTIDNPIYVSYTWSLGSFLVSRYRIYLGASNRPIDWKFQGSNDLIVWDDLDLRTGQTGDRSEWLTFDIPNNQYYSSYRILCYAGASSSYPVRIYEMELWVDESSITTTSSTTTASSSSSTSTTLSSTQTTRTTATTATTVRTTSTGPSLSISTTPPPDVERLWPMETELSIVRNNFNEWYNSGIPLGVKKVDVLPIWFPEFAGSILYLVPENNYYIATDTGWELLSLGSVPHAEQHAPNMPDEFIHIGPTVPESEFTGKMWLDVDQNLTTTTLTTTTLTTTLTSSTVLTSTLTTELSSTSASSTYTTTTTATNTTASTTTLQNPVNIAVGGTTTADSWEIGLEANKAFDGLDATEWVTNFYQDHFPHWIKYTLKSAEIVHTYSIVWDYDRYAYSWYFEGSNNSYIWDTLDFVQSHEPLDGMNYYHTSNLSPYKYYRFRFLSGNDYRHSSIGIYNIELYAGGLTTTSTTTTESTTTTTLTSTLTTVTTASSSTQLVYGFLSSGGIAVASDEYLGYPATNAFDSSFYTYWICDIVSGPPYWVMYYWPGSSYIVNKYNLHTYTLGRPKTWKFQGSVDGSIWTDLDYQEGISEEGDLEFIFENASFYSYYRFLILETHSTGYAIRIGNLELYGYRSELSTSTTTLTTTTTTTLTTTTTSTVTTASTTVYVPLQQKFLMNFNGINNSIATVDDTGRHDGLAWAGDARIKTDRCMYGTSSLNLPSDTYYPSQDSESYVSVQYSYDWRLGAGRGNFSVDFWLYLERYQYLWKNWNTVVCCFESLDNYWAIRYYPEGEILNFSIRVNKSLLINYSTRVNWSYGQWNHIALTRLGNTFKFYHNGIPTDIGTICDVEIPVINGSLLIGKGPSEYLNTLLDLNQGSFWLDSLRIYLNTLFTSEFDIPSQPTTSTTLSTSSSSTTSYQVPNYTPKLTLDCNDGEYFLYDSSGRHGVTSLSEDSTFTTQFRSTADHVIDPLFGEVFFSSHKYPMDIDNSEAGWVTFPNHVDWRLSGANDFTVEGWLIYKNTQFRYESSVLSYYQDASNFWVINIDCEQRKLFFKVRLAGLMVINYSASINLQSLSWNYFALVRKQKMFRLFWNGEPCGEWSNMSLTVIPYLDSGMLYVFGGPCPSNYGYIMPSGIACNGLRISEGIVDGVEDGAIPSFKF